MSLFFSVTKFGSHEYGGQRNFYVNYCYYYYYFYYYYFDFLALEKSNVNTT